MEQTPQNRPKNKTGYQQFYVATINFLYLTMISKQTAKTGYKWLIIPIMAILCFALTLLAAHNPAFVEKWYSQGLYPVLSGILSAISSRFPFSLADLFYVLLLALLPILIVLLAFRKISLRFTGKFVLNIVALVYLLFYLFWGLNYFRQDLNTRLGITTSATNKYEFLEVMYRLIDATNTSYIDINQLDKTKVDSSIEASYKELAETLKLDYPAGSRKDKKITLSKLFAKSGITGYYGPFFNEVHVNKEVLPVEYPVVLAHEKAHQFGVTAESEANFYAWLVCRQSKSQVLNYSANLFILRYFFSQARQLEEYPKLVSRIDPKVQKDFDKIREHWQMLRNEKYERVASKVNDTYLKTNNIEAGINDYYGVVKHVMNFSLDSGFRQQHHLAAP